MARFKNYRNPLNNSDSIYSAEDFFNMSLNNISDNLDILNAQDRTIGIPYNEELQSSPNTVYVDSYTRADGTPVQAHWRSKSDAQGAFGQMQTTPNYTNSQPINTASFVDNGLNMPTSINDNVQTHRQLQGQNYQNPMPVFNTGVGQMNNPILGNFKTPSLDNTQPTLGNFDMLQTNTPTLANYGQSFNNAQPTLDNFGKQLSNTQPTLANFDNQFMNGVDNQTQNSSYKVINDAICHLMSGKSIQECSPETLKYMNKKITEAVTGKPKQEYSPEYIEYMNKKLIQEINSAYEPPKVSEKENTERFMNEFTRSMLSQMIKEAQNSFNIANGTETGYAADISMENNAEVLPIQNQNATIPSKENNQDIKNVASKTLFGGISEDYNLPSTITQNKAIDDVNKYPLPNIYVDNKGNIVACGDEREKYKETFFVKPFKKLIRSANDFLNKKYSFAKEAFDISTKSQENLKNTNEYVVANAKDKEILKSKNIAFDNDKKTLIFTPQSLAVQAVKESKDFRKMLKKWFDGETLDGQVRPQKFSVILADNPNIFRSIHGATVRNVRDNGDGTVSCELTDFYDFEKERNIRSKCLTMLQNNLEVLKKSLPKNKYNNDLSYSNLKNIVEEIYKNPELLNTKYKNILIDNFENISNLSTNFSKGLKNTYRSCSILIYNNVAYYLQCLNALSNYNLVIPITINKINIK